MSQETKKQNDKLPFLLEIGSEEIPARFIPGAMKHLEAAIGKELKANFLTWDQLQVWATPRRLAVFVDGLSVRQPDRDVEIKGPPVKVAFDAEGQPTPAALGFLKKVGLDLEDCQRGEDQRGEFLFVRKTEPGLSAAQVLGDILPGLILGIPFRKTMKWGNYDLEYARPLQWLVVLLGPDIVPVRVDYLESGRVTRGHRTLFLDKPVELDSPGAYLPNLLKAGVVADHHERRRLIHQGLESALEKYDSEARLLEDKELLTEVVFLCEHPTPFLGSFGEKYLELPAQVVTTAMKSHQRYFSVERKDGKGLKPCFAAVRCGGRDHLDKVVAGNERVLHARLADALFYWEFDQKKTPDQRAEMLGSVTWLEGFGSVLDKSRRIAELSDWLWNNGFGGDMEQKRDLDRAARICKSDLVSEMIKDGKEFTKLEGFIGARYAELAGESPAVCQAIEQHFLPRSATGKLPADRISAVLSVADRLDNVAGCWLAGFVPTGAKDPYALRRHVLAILRILLDEKAHINLEQGLKYALSRVSAFAKDTNLTEVEIAIGGFVKTRLQGFFCENLSRHPDVVRAVVPVRWRDPVDALDWVDALTNYRDRDDFQQLATGFKRCRNILKGEVLPVTALENCMQRWSRGGRGASGEDFGEMPDKLEQKFLSSVVKAAGGLLEAEKAHNYNQVFALLSGLGPSIDEYFEKVRVNAEEPELRLLRHGFLREIHGLFARYADFTEIAASEK
jgi:glycyl-tRNA synthetase beta chain